VLFKHFEGLLDKVSKNKGLSLTVLDFVTQVAVAVFEQVEDGQDLSVVGHEGFSNCV
jgi:urease gamma subunit